MRGDWIKLHRKALDTPAFADDWLWRLWCWCLLKARYRAGKGLKSGQFVTGRFAASEELGVHGSRLYRGLQRLQELGYVRLEANNQKTIVTVVNWRTYQADDIEDRTASEQPANNERTTSEQPANTIEEGKKVRREEGKKKTERRFTPPVVAEVAAYCDERKNGIDPEAFVAFYESKGWRVGNQAMRDWRKAVITWEKRRAEQTKPKPQASVYDPHAVGSF